MSTQTSALPAPPPSLRWTVLVLLSIAMMGNYYVYDCIGPLADLLSKQLGFSDKQIGLLQAIYSIPNIFMVLVGGVLIDRIGVKKASLLFGGICCLGALLTAASPSFYVMAAGRLVFGLGAESLIVAVTTALAIWFKGKELGFAFGLNLTIARAGSYLAQTSTAWAPGAYASWRAPLLIALVFGAVCVIAPLAYYAVESSAKKRYALAAQGSTDKVSWGDVLAFKTSYWWVVALCVTFYSAIFPFQTFAQKFFIDAHGATPQSAGLLVGNLTLFAMIGTPLFGLLVDKTGKRALFMMAGSLMLMPVYLMMAHTKIPLTVPMGMMGLAYALIPAVMWPSVTYLVPEGKLGTAYGLMTLIQNVGLAGFNFLVGSANDMQGASATNPGGYALGMWIFSTLGLFGFVFAFLLRRSEGAHGPLETVKAGGPAPATP